MLLAVGFCDCDRDRDRDSLYVSIVCLCGMYAHTQLSSAQHCARLCCLMVEREAFSWRVYLGLLSPWNKLVRLQNVKCLLSAKTDSWTPRLQDCISKVRHLPKVGRAPHFWKASASDLGSNSVTVTMTAWHDGVIIASWSGPRHVTYHSCTKPLLLSSWQPEPLTEACQQNCRQKTLSRSL